VVTLLCIALAVPVTDVGAASSKSKRAQIKALEAKTQRLERRIARQRNHLSTLRGQVATLQQSQGNLTSQLGVAHADSAALRGQLASTPSALSRAVEQVRREVAYVDLFRGDPSIELPPREELLARAAMDYVVGHVTAPGYGYMNVVLGAPPAVAAETALQSGSGICGHAAFTFAAIVKQFGLRVRSVQFYYANGVDNHIAAEVFYDGGWHYFDPTWGAYYEDGGRTMSIEEARASSAPRTLLRQNETLLWRSVQSLAGVAPLGAETDAATRMELDKQPFP
jgi:hypothetical protein